MANEDVLSARYATPKMNAIFSEEGKTIAERELWIAVMKAQKELGMNIPSEDIEKFERAKENIDLSRIKEIEKKTRHDVKAKIQAFIEAAGAGEYIHLGMTSRDLTDNVEQMQIRDASGVVFGKYVSVLRHMIEKAVEYSDIMMSARTHHQHAQPTLLGRRMSMWAEELWLHLGSFEDFINKYPLRGIKGPVGTQFDMLTLLKSQEKVTELEKKIAEHLGFSAVLDSPGQVYPRSLDQAVCSRLAELTSACADYATTMRLMAGESLVTEGFKKGQTGSSAMPHKMNTRSSERVCGLADVIKAYAVGAIMNAGKQWEEGDVSCSVPRRIFVPGIFYASDGLCETTLTVLNEMGAYTSVIGRQVDKYLPFLATTELLMMAVEAGIGRETAHGIIKKYATAEGRRMMEGGSDVNSLPKLLAADPAFKEAGITLERINAALADKQHFVGMAGEQITAVFKKAGPMIVRYNDAAAYEPGDIL